MGLSDRLKKFENINEYTSSLNEGAGNVTKPQVDFNDFIMEALSKKVASVPVWFDYDYDKKFELILSFLDNKINTEFEGLAISNEEKKALAEEFLKTNYGFGVLDRLLAKEDVSAVVVNSLLDVQVYRSAHWEKTNIDLSQNQFDYLFAGFNHNNAISKSCRGLFHITVLAPPVSQKTIVIRKIKIVDDSIETMFQKSLIPYDLAYFLNEILLKKKNILLSSEKSEYLSEFLQVLLNSVDKDKRCAIVEDSGLFVENNENISIFNVSLIEDFDYEYLISTLEDLDFDFTASFISDYKKFSAYYLRQNDLQTGLVTTLQAHSTSDTAGKLTALIAAALKCTEKHAKQRLSSVYDFIIHIDKSNSSCHISSIMEITSTKSSSLVMNEVVKFVDGGYALDLPDEFLHEPEISETEDIPVPDSFRVRLKEL